MDTYDGSVEGESISPEQLLLTFHNFGENIRTMNTKVEMQEQKYADLQALVKEQNQKIEDLHTLLLSSNFTIPTNGREAFKLLQVAVKFDLKRLVYQCVNVLLDTLTTENVISIFQFANKNKFGDLKDLAQGIIQENFLQLTKSSNSKDWEKLEFEELRTLLTSDNLNVEREEDVFDTLVAWIGDDEERKKHLPELMKCVRLENYQQNLLRALSSHRLFNECELVQEYIGTFLGNTELAASAKRPERATKAVKRERPVAFVLGGMDNSGVVETLNSEKSSWLVQHKIVNAPSCYVMAVALENSVLVIEPSCKRVRIFDAVQKLWRTKASMKNPRFDTSATVLDGLVYVLGGVLNDQTTSKCEEYDPKRDVWTEINNLKTARRNSSAVSFNGKIICAGGKDGAGKAKVINSAESWDPESKEWTCIHNMVKARWRHCLVASDSYVFAFGGSNGKRPINDMERYNPESNTWEEMEPLHTARFAFAAVRLGEDIYVIGGYGGDTKEDLDSTEVYSLGDGTWSTGPKLHTARRWHAACALTGLPNAAEYLVPAT